MNLDELLRRLEEGEWSDLEAKEARRAVPKSAYEAVSAFANTEGGRLVFGVRDHRDRFEIVGVIEVDKVQGEFLSTLRSESKLSRPVTASGDRLETNDGTLLVFHIPESPRGDKPIYLDGDIRRSFLRRGGTNQRCTVREIERFLRDADGRHDSGIIEDVKADRFFDPASVLWYRRVFSAQNTRRHDALSDVEFLVETGFVVERGDRLAPTRAGILLFGRERHLSRILLRPVVDLQSIPIRAGSWTTDQRWSDRLVAEENLVQTWLSVSEWYRRRAEHPFRLDAATLRRDDDPPDFVAFREAAINLLIHQDYGDPGRKAVIRFFRDRTVFWNPGDAFGATDELLDPTEKEVRNPAIVTAFRRIGLSEQAGTGIRAIFRNWRQLGYAPPVIENRKAGKSFEISLLREELLDDSERRFQARLGLRLEDSQARLLALARRNGAVSITDAKAVSGRPGPAAHEVLRNLETVGLLQAVAGGNRYEPPDHLRSRPDRTGLGHSDSDQVGERPAPLGSDQVAGAGSATAAAPLSDNQRLVLAACETPRSLAQIMERVGAGHRSYFRKKRLRPLLDAGLLRMTRPGAPRAANQKYVLTERGAAALTAPVIGAVERA